jgi:hypothetical protein
METRRRRYGGRLAAPLGRYLRSRQGLFEPAPSATLAQARIGQDGVTAAVVADNLAGRATGPPIDAAERRSPPKPKRG